MGAYGKRNVAQNVWFTYLKDWRTAAEFTVPAVQTKAQALKEKDRRCYEASLFHSNFIKRETGSVN